MRKRDIVIAVLILSPIALIGILLYSRPADAYVEPNNLEVSPSIETASKRIEDGILVEMGAGWTDYVNADNSHTMSIGISNMWDGKEWRPSDELSKIVKVEYKNGLINISTPYWFETYELVSGDKNKEDKLASISAKQDLIVIDKLSSVEYGLNVSGIPMDSKTPMDYIGFKKVAGGGNKMNLEIDYSSLETQGFTLDKTNKDFVKVTNPIDKISSGSLYLDPTVTLMNGNVTDDAVIDAAFGDTNSDLGQMVSMTGTWAAVDDTKAPVIKINGLRTFIPADAVITNAQFVMKVIDAPLDPGEQYNYDAQHIYNVNRYNISGVEWTEGNFADTWSCVVAGSGITGSEIYWAVKPTPDSQMNRTYESRRVSVDGGSAAAWTANWTVTNMVRTEFNLGSNNVSIMINTTRAAGSPAETDCARFDASENVTAGSRPYLNVTYTLPPPRHSLNQTNSTLAGSDVNHSLNWSSSAGLSGYIFSFCNGTWNGTNCLAYRNITTIITLSNAITENLADIYHSSGNPIGFQIKWNISSIPAGQIIKSANLSLYVDNKVGTVDTDIRVWHIGNSNWNEASTSSVIAAQAKTNQSDEIWNATSSTGVWLKTNVTNIVKTDYGNNSKNTTMRLEDVDNLVGSINDVGDFAGQLIFGEIGTPNAVYFRAREDASNIPILTISYSSEQLGDYGWVNSTWSSFGASTWSNVTKTINSTVGANIAWRVYANDTYNSWNASEVYSYVTTSSADSQSPKYSNVGVNNSSPPPLAQVLYYANWTDNVGLGHWIFSWNATGALCTGGFANDTEVAFGAGTWSNVTKQMPLACAGKTIDFIFYANDTSNNWNSTGDTYETEQSLPQVSIVSPTNTTYASNPVFFNVSLNVAGSWCGYSLNGSANSTMLNVSGQWRMNETLGNSAYNVKFYCNDTGGNMNGTEQQWFSVSVAADTCTYVSGNWAIDCSDECVITNSVNVAGNIYLNGAGTFYTNSDIGYTGNVEITGGCHVTCDSGCLKKRT